MKASFEVFCRYCGAPKDALAEIARLQGEVTQLKADRTTAIREMEQANVGASIADAMRKKAEAALAELKRTA